MQFTEAAGQIAGQVGQVVALADPAVSQEWVVVRFGRDELPFSPGDLRVAPRGATGRKVAAPPPPTRAEPEFVIDKPVPAATAPTAARNGQDGLPAPRQAAVRQPGASAATAAGSAAPTPAPRKAAGRPARVKAAASLTVTLAYAEGEWTVAATQGSKALAKPYVVRPAEALRMVSLVDVPGVREAVEQILAAEREQVQAQAQRLRAELAETEARLAELGDMG